MVQMLNYMKLTLDGYKMNLKNSFLSYKNKEIFIFLYFYRTSSFWNR